MDNISQFLKGNVKIKVTGTQPERFINLCLVNKISLSEISRVGERAIVARLDARDVKHLRPILRKSACRMKIISKSGLPFIRKKALRRKGFMTGGLLFCLCLYIFSTFIWSIDVATPKPLKFVSEDKILAQAKQYGLKRGVSKLFIDNNNLREQLMRDFPDASWIGIDISGTRAIITIYERYKAPEEESTEPADLIAEKDAVIDEIFAIKGTPVVKAGSTVKKGDLLISARVYPTVIAGQEPYSGEPIYTRAKGIVRARTWYEARANALLKEDNYVRTGRNTFGLVLGIPDGSQKIFKFRNFAAFEESTLKSWRNNSFILELKIQKYNEIKKVKTVRSLNEAKKSASESADQKLTMQLPPEAKLVNKNYIWYNIKNGISVRAIWEVKETIGVNPN